MIVRTLRGLVAATLLLTAVAATAEAQAASPRFGFNAGIGLPMGDFDDAAEMGFHAGFQWQTGLTESLDLRLNADFGRYGLPSGIDGEWTLIGGMANIVAGFGGSGNLKPYVLAGLGMYNAKVNIDGFGSEDETKLGFNVGAGFNFMAGSLNMFTEAKFVSIQTSGDALNTLPIVIGFRF